MPLYINALNLFVRTRKPGRVVILKSHSSAVKMSSFTCGRRRAFLSSFTVGLLLVSCLASCVLAHKVRGLSLESQWETWKEKHGKKYSSPSEEAQRRATWERNFAFVQQHNSKAEKTFELAMNKFADQSKVV